MTDLSTLNAELANFDSTHVFVGSQAVADHEQGVSSGQIVPETLEHHLPVLLHIDRDSAAAVRIQVVAEGLPDGPPEASVVEEYREDYKKAVGSLQDVHASGTSIAETENDILVDTAKRMTDSGLHLLGGYAVGKTDRTGTIISSLFYHKTFSEAYKRGMLASINASGFDIKRLPPEEQLRIEAMARMEDTRETTIGCASLIASLLPQPAEAFPGL